jgi:hypothetical protein
MPTIQHPERRGGRSRAAGPAGIAGGGHGLACIALSTEVMANWKLPPLLVGTYLNVNFKNRRIMNISKKHFILINTYLKFIKNLLK